MCALLWYVIECLCVIAANIHVCIRDKMWWREFEVADMVSNTTLDEYLSIDGDLPTHGVKLLSIDDAPILNTLNDDDDEEDPVPLGSELNYIQAVGMIVQLCNFMATKDNVDYHVAALSNALDYIGEAQLKVKKQITDFFHM